MLRLTAQLRNRLAVQWQRVDRNDFDSSVGLLLPTLTALVAQAQVQAAEESQRFIEQVDAFNGVQSDVQVAPPAFAGVDWDGLRLEPMILFASTMMKQRMLAGAPAVDAVQTGLHYTTTLGTTATLDAGREAARVSWLAREVYVNWVRMIQPGACGRCIVLAGKQSRERAFPRHPRCRCVAVPSMEVTDGSVETDPQAFFDGLSREEQDKAFTKTGAEAIRAGADMGRVVNARRGATGIKYGPRILPTVDGPNPTRRLQPTKIGEYQGKPIHVYQTTELTGKRARSTYKYGSIDRRLPQGVRLMPETIVKLSRGNQKELERLLRHYGYIV